MGEQNSLFQCQKISNILKLTNWTFVKRQLEVIEFIFQVLAHKSSLKYMYKKHNMFYLKSSSPEPMDHFQPNFTQSIHGYY